ncbi:diguanylate cyclase domain-containing protein [Clostridioides difficile]|nr:diguanylate cyclase [Clostridioides difficile]
MENNTIQEQLCDLSKKIWHIYVLNPDEAGLQFIISLLDDNFTLFGTGKHEFYTSLENFIINLEKDQEESEEINFKIIDEWYSCTKVTNETFIVYGTLWVIEDEYLEKDIYVEMDTRFTMVYKVIDGKITLLHVHHSIPNFDQAKDEYYPKTITEKAKEALAMANEFKLKSEKDLMTGLYNRHFFEVKIKEMLETTSCGYFYIFDLDNFKQINDIFGHIRGDEILIQFANILTKVFGNDAIIGRLGGDEFAVFEYINQSKEDVENKAKKVAQLCYDSNSCSIGISKLESNLDTFQSLYKQSDYALYYTKRNNKGSFSWF